MRQSFGILVLLSILFCAQSVQAKITIAMIAPMAGDYAVQGQELIKGAEHAVEELNQQGGVLKNKISLLKIDDQCNDSIALSTAQMLTILKDKKISAIIGPYCANALANITEIYAQAKIFQIIPVPVNYLLENVSHKGLVKLLGHSDQEAKDFFAFYNSRYAGDRVALVYNTKNQDSVAAAQSVAQEFLKHGKSSLISEYTYQMTEKDYEALADKILADNVRTAFLFGSSANIRKIAYELRQKNKKFVIFTNRYKAGEKYFDLLEELANGTFFTGLSGSSDNPEFTETLVNLRLNGFDAEGISLYGYAAIKLWATLAQKAKSTDYDKLSAVVKNRTVPTVFGDKTFRNGAPKSNEKYAIYRYWKGTFVKVY